MKDLFKRAKASTQYCIKHDIDATSCGCAGLTRKAKARLKRDLLKEIAEAERELEDDQE